MYARRSLYVQSCTFYLKKRNFCRLQFGDVSLKFSVECLLLLLSHLFCFWWTLFAVRFWHTFYRHTCISAPEIWVEYIMHVTVQRTERKKSFPHGRNQLTVLTMQKRYSKSIFSAQKGNLKFSLCSSHEERLYFLSLVKPISIETILNIFCKENQFSWCIPTALSNFCIIDFPQDEPIWLSQI